MLTYESKLLRAIEEGTASVAVMGQGYVGLPLAVRAAEVGFRVVGVEPDRTRREDLETARSFISDVSDARLRQAMNSNLSFAQAIPDDLDADIIVISVPTPLRDGLPDLSFVETAALEAGRHLKGGSCVILESTTFPGTTEEVVLPILSETSGLDREEFFLGYSPERIDPGNETFTLVTTPKLVSGVTAGSNRVVRAFFERIVETVISVESCAEAELAKLLENTFRHVNVALVNELACFASEMGLDIWRIVEAAGTKPFGFMKFLPGPGVGGHCLPVDPTFLSWRIERVTGRPFRFVELANEVNGMMPSVVVDRIERLLARRGMGLVGASVELLGVAYKANSSDWRESPALEVARLLRSSGAVVQITDPMLHFDQVLSNGFIANSTTGSSKEVDIGVVMTAHSKFDWAEIALSYSLLLDTRNALAGLDFSGERL